MVHCNFFKIIIISGVYFTLGFGNIKGTNNKHRTKAAAEKQHDLSCYRCDTMVDGDRCMKLNNTEDNFQYNCTSGDKICKVKKISMSTSTEDKLGTPILWLLQRNCTKSCEEGCIVIGERTKLYSCTSCCETNLCNLGSGGDVPSPKELYSVILPFVVALKHLLLRPFL